MPIDADTKNDIIEAIKEETGEAKVKCIGLFKNLNEVYEADDKYEKESLTISYSTHQELRGLYSSALDIMRDRIKFSTEAVPNLNEFFTPEELQSAEFKEQQPEVETEGFWLGLLRKCEIIGDSITDKDAEVLKYLDHIEVILSETSPNYSIEFTFKPNDYFVNQKLTLEVILESEDGDMDDINEIKSTEIAWNPNKNITVTTVEKKQKNKKSKQVRTVTKEERCESFFNLFKHHVPVEEEEDEEEPDYNFDPLSDHQLFYTACDICESLKNSFFHFIIPAVYGIISEEFKIASDDHEDHEGHEGCKKKEGAHAQGGKSAQNPECKQQ